MKVHWTTEKRPVSELRDFPNNPRTHVLKGVEDLRQSFQSLGYVEPIAINTDGTILSGHARKKVLQDLGVVEVDVRIPERTLTDSECREVVVRLNKNVAGVWDMETLTGDFDVDDLRDWGFTDFDLGIHGLPEGIEFDESLTDGESILATFKVKLPEHSGMKCLWLFPANSSSHFDAKITHGDCFLFRHQSKSSMYGLNMNTLLRIKPVISSSHPC